MTGLAERSLQALADFFALGGWVLWAILGAAIALWTLISLRWLFLWFGFPALRARLISQWQALPEHRSWAAGAERLRLISRATLASFRGLVLMRALLAVLPLLGLLGTVRGMIEVFHVMGYTGTGDVRALAAGIYQATLPTMAGLVCALSGLLPVSRLGRSAAQRVAALERALVAVD